MAPRSAPAGGWYEKVRVTAAQATQMAYSSPPSKRWASVCGHRLLRSSRSCGYGQPPSGVSKACMLGVGLWKLSFA